MKLLEGHRDILHIAIPAIISNITVPLLSITDTTIAGHLGATRYIGAIAVGSMIFNVIYWIFGFLRMGTSGLTAQAFGRQDEAEMHRMLLRTLAVGACIGLLLVLLQKPLLTIAFALIQCSPEVEILTHQYFDIIIWGAPAVLMLYGLNGWFLGMQNSHYPMFAALLQNIINIAVSLFLVLVFHLQIEGIAAGTVLAQYAGLAISFVLCKRFKALAQAVSFQSLFEKKVMKSFFTVNRDIFLRTLCLVGVMTFFTSSGAAQGTGILSANALLMEFFMLFSFFIDGFAYAGEALSGRYVGEQNVLEFRRNTHRLFGWGLTLALLFSLSYICCGRAFLFFLTNQEAVVDEALTFLPWLAAVPIVSIAGFLFDGIYIGATATRIMLFSATGGTALFFVSLFLLEPSYENHALWAAFILCLGMRGAICLYFYPHVVKNIRHNIEKE